MMRRAATAARHPRRALAAQLVWSQEGASLARRYRLLNSSLIRWPCEIRWVAAFDAFVVDDGEASLIVPRKARLWKYRDGVAQRLEALAREFGASDLPLNPSEPVIDCGANVGEFSLWAARTTGCRVIAVEPDPVEFAALERNLAPSGATAVHAGLWHEPGEMQIYLGNDRGDTTLIDPGGSPPTTTVRTVTLDALCLEVAPDGVIGLLKLEAEGAEPEILAGAEETLRRTRFVTVDVGPERGPARESTAPAVTTLLTDAGFRLRALVPSRPSMVFEASIGT
ncbi:MAG: FkbM family methyltransferase [Acidimicrobiales bacterium]